MRGEAIPRYNSGIASVATLPRNDKGIMKLYNTLTHRKEEFKPLKKGRVGFYSCGPTVYNFAHIGNLRTYVFADVLQRVLEYGGYRVKRVMNITDVGHLTSDADSGEDKVEKEAARAHKSPWEIVKFYTHAFLRDIAELNIKKPKIIVAASKTVKEQIGIIKKLFAKGYAYETSEAVYFHAPKFKNYGQLSGQSLNEKLTAVRSEVVEDKEKKHPADFALWFKRVGRHAHHIMRWPSPWGKGFPGWHIECSAISTKYLGQPFDIHTGGVDLIGTHHANEIAQSEAAFGKPFARFWLHGEFLLIDKSKMAKSQGNFITLSTLKEKGFSPLDFRYLCLTAHYRSRLNFSWESLAAARNAYHRLLEAVADFQSNINGQMSNVREPETGSWHKNFLGFVNDDLNAPEALALLWEVVRSPKLLSSAKLSLVRDFDKVLGLDIIKQAKAVKTSAKIPAAINKIARERQAFRQAKKYTEADKLRLKLAKKGYTVDDLPGGFRLHKTAK